jgi:putative hydrolase of the HAD superfamily
MSTKRLSRHCLTRIHWKINPKNVTLFTKQGKLHAPTTMIKALFFDGDGLAIKQTRYFSDVYAEENNLPPDRVNPFFRGPFRLCQRGQANLKVELIPYLEAWGWKGTVDEFLNKWFVTSTEADERVMAIVQALRTKGYKCYMVSNQEKFRGEYISKTLQFEKHFDGVFYSYNLGYQKSDKGFFHTILRELKLLPEEVMLWDDNDSNFQTAKELGIVAKRYTTFEEFEKEIKAL